MFKYTFDCVEKRQTAKYQPLIIVSLGTPVCINLQQTLALVYMYTLIAFNTKR